MVSPEPDRADGAGPTAAHGDPPAVGAVTVSSRLPHPVRGPRRDDASARTAVTDLAVGAPPPPAATPVDHEARDPVLTTARSGPYAQRILQEYAARILQAHRAPTSV